MPARLGRGRVGFPPHPSTGAVRDGWAGGVPLRWAPGAARAGAAAAGHRNRAGTVGLAGVARATAAPLRPMLQVWL